MSGPGRYRISKQLFSPNLEKKLFQCLLKHQHVNVNVHVCSHASDPCTQCICSIPEVEMIENDSSEELHARIRPNS